MDDFKLVLAKRFEEVFNSAPENYFLSPGRLEIIGNHTDHNHGLALVASASLYIKAAVKRRDDNIINLNSNGSEFYGIKVQKKEPDANDDSTTYGLINGVVNGFLNHGYNVGGFDCFCLSDVPSGGGVSSSAAFELLICAILNSLYNDGNLDKIELAKISQYAERTYFNKPCGILDQIGAAFGGICYVDFNDPSNPIVKSTSFPFKDVKIVLTNPGGSHAGLNSYYAAIPSDMYSVAKKMGKNVLREISFEEFNAYLEKHKDEFTPMEINRATHYYTECFRVEDAYKSLINEDLEGFLKNIRESGLSSSFVLQNTVVKGRYNHSPERALKTARKAAPNSAHRVHGGGFMGTIISFVKNEEYDELVKQEVSNFGSKAIIDVSISPFGATEIK